MKQQMNPITSALVKVSWFALGLLWIAASSANGAEIVVNSETDPGISGDGNCSMREALENANQDTNTAGGDCAAGNGDDFITFDFTQVSRIVLAGSRLEFSGPGTIDGDQNGDGVPDVEITAFDPTDTLSRSGVIDINSAGGPVEIRGLKITGARGTSALILSGFPEIRVTDCIVEDNQLDSGGTGGAAIDIRGSLVTIEKSKITNNSVLQTGAGGAIHIGGFGSTTVLIADTLISDNSAAGSGGGLFVSKNGNIRILRSRVENNLSGTSAGPDNENASGGGLFADRGTIEIEDSVFSGNTVTAGSVESIGGAIRTENFASVQIKSSLLTGNTATRSSALFISGGLSSIENSTVSRNTARLGTTGETIASDTLLTISNSTIFDNEGSGLEAISISTNTDIVLNNSIIANSTSSDCVGSSSNIDSDNATIIQDDGCNSSARNVDPLLGPLSNNGGFAQSHLPDPGSPALDSGLTDCLPTDQRGVGREDPCDVGAVERVLLEMSDGPPILGIAWHQLTSGSRGAFQTRLGPTADAEFVFGLGQDVNDGAVLPTATTPTGEYQAEINVTNLSPNPALACGWFDFNQDSSYSNLPNTLTSTSDPDVALRDDTGERSCIEIAPGTTEQNFPLLWTVAAQERQRSGQFNIRFRISTDPDFFNGSSLASTGGAIDGEVEDYAATIDTLPVSVHHFRSYMDQEGLQIEWGTVSETHNTGFSVIAHDGDEWTLLNRQLIASKSRDPVWPERYRLTIDGPAAQQISKLALVSLDMQGEEAIYGVFDSGRAYGRAVDPAPIAWSRITERAQSRADVKRRAELEFHPSANRKGFDGESRAGSNIQSVDVMAGPPGLYQITWQDITDAGLDLTDVDPDSIAVTLKGEAIARDVVVVGAGASVRLKTAASPFHKGPETRRATTFGPGSAIRFWARTPTLPDALYLEGYTYRISVEPADAQVASVIDTKPKPGPASVIERLHKDTNTAYSFASPHSDPWYAARLRADQNNAYTAIFEIDDELVTSKAGRVEVLVAGLTDFPENPDHMIRVEVNGKIVAERVFDGRAVRQISADIPGNLLMTGENIVRIIAPGGTGAPFDISLVDTISLEYHRALAVRNDILLMEKVAHTGGLTISGLTTLDTVAYARDGADLFRLPREQFSRGSVRVPTITSDHADYWISSTEKINRASVMSAVPSANILEGVTADLIAIAHPSFIPISSDEPHPLNAWLEEKRAQGWSPAVFDITQIQQHFGHGMPLPEAVTNFLREADSRFEYEHVLLIGGDSYDYSDNLGLGSISFIPTRYVPTAFVPHTPSDSLLADIDGDGMPDKALGRWPVRSVADLQAIVTKTLDWAGDPNAISNAVWIADSQDPSQPSFESQVERMVAPLLEAGWSENSLSKILLDDAVAPPGSTAVDAARATFFNRLETNRSISGFVGHGAPAMWTFQGLLTPDDLNDLFNEGMPTLIGTLTCYTTYFVSPFSDSVAHRWMNGYREDAFGEQIEGVPNGAVAIHGAATLSSFEQNEWFSRKVLLNQLDGLTLGESILRTRELIVDGSDLIFNWTLLGDPTIRLD